MDLTEGSLNWAYKNEFKLLHEVDESYFVALKFPIVL